MVLYRGVHLVDALVEGFRGRETGSLKKGKHVGWINGAVEAKIRTKCVVSGRRQRSTREKHTRVYTSNTQQEEQKHDHNRKQKHKNSIETKSTGKIQTKNEKKKVQGVFEARQHTLVNMSSLRIAVPVGHHCTDLPTPDLLKEYLKEYPHTPYNCEYPSIAPDSTKALPANTYRDTRLHGSNRNNTNESLLSDYQSVFRLKKRRVVHMNPC